MFRISLYSLLLLLCGCSHPQAGKGKPAGAAQAGRVTIIRDKWGIPHIYGKEDADAVFGLMYAQCEDDFERVERAYVERLGRLSELEGEAYLYQDLQLQLLYDTAAAKKAYAESPPWLQKLAGAFSDGIHYFLDTHPEVQPRLIRRFEPWFPFLFYDGAYISTKNGGLRMEDMKARFGRDLAMDPPQEVEPPAGSNGFAIAPSRSRSGEALLFINPHVSFYFRTEAHMVSGEGLNAYGAVTWGQFFVYQGFNEFCGWMHTSTAADAADLYALQVEKKDGGLYYRYEDSLLPLRTRTIQLRHKESKTARRVVAHSSHHGPIVGERQGKWLALKAAVHYREGLMQSWLRTKARSWEAFLEALQLRANASTNTLYADREGRIAYWHGNYVPRRKSGVETGALLDGHGAAAAWGPPHDLEELPHFINPLSGFLQNCNASPFSAAGHQSLPPRAYPAYMAPEGENFRSLLALKELSKGQLYDPQSLIGLGHSTYLAAFDSLLPPLFRDFGQLPAAHPYRQQLAEIVDTLQRWDRRTAISSVAATVAVFWSYSLLSGEQQPPEAMAANEVQTLGWIARHTDIEWRLKALAGVAGGLQRMYGSWKIPWGRINRFLRVRYPEEIDGTAEGLAAPFGPAFLGSLPSFETAWKGGRQFGIAGNSFVALVSFGKTIRAWSISTGGQSGNPASPHYNDQAELYLKGALKEVYFYRPDVERHAERKYRPGE